MPASRPRKAKPVEMRRTERLCTVFDHSHAMMATTIATTTICQNSPENCLSFSEICIRRNGGEAGVSVVTAQASCSGMSAAKRKYFICCNRVQYVKQMFHERQAIAPERTLQRVA